MNEKKCPIMEKCGGCQYLGIPYEEQLRQKQQKLQKLLGNMVTLEPIIGMENPYYYRNKVTATFGRTKDGTVYAGIYEEKSHRLLKRSGCFLENELAGQIIDELTKMVKSFKWTVYNEKSGYGLIRHAMIRIARQTGEVMVILVTTSNILPGARNFARALKSRFPEITTIVQNVNDRQTTMVLGQRDIVLYGKGYIEDILCGCRFRLSPQSFYQINPVQTELLYRKALEYAGLEPIRNAPADSSSHPGDPSDSPAVRNHGGKRAVRVLDTYCGIGTIGICAAKYAGNVIGAELNREAVKDAKRNAERNGLTNIRFVNADATQFMTQMAEEKEPVDVLFMDPPRSGSTEEFLRAAIRLSPERIVYVSCGPDTLARDLKFVLRNSCYVVKRAVGVDMFPGTSHVETVCLLSKLHEAKHHVNVTLDMDELDITSAESKATYEEIRNWVQEQYGFHVTNLNIAQIKQKHGIIERENYNKAKSEDSRQPRCPEEKINAIEDAMRHFQRID